MTDKLINKLQGLIQELDRCCRCEKPNREPCATHSSRIWRDVPPNGKRKVPFEIDWDAYPMITGMPVLETRPRANLLELGAAELAKPRPGLQYERRAWLPAPVNLGGNGTPWDLRRYRSRELVLGQIHAGCACPKRNGLQDECRRLDCRGRSTCLATPVPLCRPSGGPGGNDARPSTMHKANCWCEQCRPPCCDTKRMKMPGPPGPPSECPECLCLQNLQCGSTCNHYCDKHMSGHKPIPCPPVTV